MHQIRRWECVLTPRGFDNSGGTQQVTLTTMRERELYQRYQRTLVFCVAASGVFMVLLLLFYRMSQQYSAELSTSKNELKSKNDDLKNDIALRVEQLTELSHHLLAVSEQEKASLARELHDELGSNLTAMRLDLLAVLEELKEKDANLTNQLKQTLQVLQKTFNNKRRIIESLRPSTLENLGLAAAIRAHCEELAQRTGLHIDVKIDEDSANIDPAHAIAMYRIVQESLTNTVKYARAKRVWISLSRSLQGFCLRISDDGVGVKKNAFRESRSHGIVGMRERATLLGGSFAIHAGADGHGTHIEVFLPYSDD